MAQHIQSNSDPLLGLGAFQDGRNLRKQPCVVHAVASNRDGGGHLVKGVQHLLWQKGKIASMVHHLRVEQAALGIARSKVAR